MMKLYFGIRENARSGETFHIRKRIFSDGFVISKIGYDGINMGEELFPVIHLHTLDRVNDWLRRN